MASSIRRIGRKLVSTVIETVYPRVCAGCGMRGEWVCETCVRLGLAAFGPSACQRCGVPVVQGRCKCGDLDPLISIARSAFVYEGWPAESVRLVKYHAEPARAEYLAGHMAPLLSHFGPVDGLLAVPLHPSRERQRGYNQSALVARHLAAVTGVPVVEGIQRVRKTGSQTRLSGAERRANVVGAFALDPTWSPRPGGRFVLIDDVRTTGSTLNACADVLRPYAPGMLGVLTFAVDMSREDVRALRNATP